jgi:hypothetical protein
MNAKTLTLGLGLTIMAATICSAKPWRGIVPLKSKRTDVERLLGPSNHKEVASYYLADETVYVEYAPPEDEDLKIAPGTVVTITVIPKKVLRLTELGVDLRRFKKTPGARDLVGSFIYTDESDGFVRGLYLTTLFGLLVLLLGAKDTTPVEVRITQIRNSPFLIRAILLVPTVNSILLIHVASFMHFILAAAKYNTYELGNRISNLVGRRVLRGIRGE